MEKISREEWLATLNFKDPEEVAPGVYVYRDLWDFAVKWIGKSFLKFKGKGPEDFKNDLGESNLFYVPYQRFERGEISLEEAINERNRLAAELASWVHDDLWEKALNLQFERQTGKSLQETLEKVKAGNRSAAIEIVKVFRFPRDKHPVIKAMIREATQRDDRWFLNRIKKAYDIVDIDETGRIKEYGPLQKRGWLAFVKANEGRIREHPEEVLKMARGVGLDGFTDSEWENLDDKGKAKRKEALKHFIRRHGVKVRRGRPTGTTRRKPCFVCKKLFAPVDSQNRICPRCERRLKVDSHVLDSLYPESSAGGTAAPMVQDSIKGGIPLKTEPGEFWRNESGDEARLLFAKTERAIQETQESLDRLRKLKFQKYLFSGWAEGLL